MPDPEVDMLNSSVGTSHGGIYSPRVTLSVRGDIGIY